MSDQTSPDTGVVDNEVSNPAAATETADTQVTDTQADAQEDTTAVEKLYSKAEMQEHIEKATARAAAKAERRAYREALAIRGQQPSEQTQQPRVEHRPARQSGEADDDYLERLTDWKLEQRDRASHQQRAQEENKTLTTKTERLYAEAAKQPGFDREEFNALPLTPVIAQALVDSDVAAKLMVFMSGNPEEVERIAALTPARQAAEIGKLETRLATSSPSKAPTPINPLSGGRGQASQNLESASLEEYAAMRKKQGARWAQR